MPPYRVTSMSAGVHKWKGRPVDGDGGGIVSRSLSVA